MGKIHKNLEMWLRQSKASLLILSLTVTSLVPLVVGSVHYEANTLGIAHEFMREIAKLDGGREEISEVDLSTFSDTSENENWQCTMVKIRLVDGSQVILLVRLNGAKLMIDDVVRYSIQTTQTRPHRDPECVVERFLLRLISKSVGFKEAYQQALDVLREVGVYATIEYLSNDMLYSVSAEENRLVLTWTKTINGIPGVHENYFMANNIQISVDSTGNIVFFGNTWDKYKVGNQKIRISERVAQNTALKNLVDEKQRLVDEINAELFYRQGSAGRDPGSIYPCWEVEIRYRESTEDLAGKHIAFIWGDTGALWYGADQGFYGDTSCTFACPYDLKDPEERNAQLRVTQHIHSILQGEGYTDTYIQTPYKADIVASSDASLDRHTVYFDGHGGWTSSGTPDGEAHVYIKDSNGDKVWDYEIYGQTTGLTNLVFLWACNAAYDIDRGILDSGYARGMGFAYSNRTDLSVHGYDNPDGKGFAILAFFYWAPYLINVIEGVDKAGEKFVKFFYTGLDQGDSVNEALDYAAYMVWGVPWLDCWLANSHTDEQELTPYGLGGCWGKLWCYGDGTWTLSEDSPSTPDIPAGETSPHLETAHDYSTSATDPNSHEVRYEFDWGDDTPNTWTDWNPSGQTATVSHLWDQLGTYYVRVRAANAYGGCSDWASPLAVTVTNQQPNQPERPQGPTSGSRLVSYTYKTRSTDPDGDQIRYLFDWGDNNQDWTGYKNSGAYAYKSHSWMANGIYYVTARAQDEHGAYSTWSLSLMVTIEDQSSGCPFVHVWNGTDYVLDNNVLGMSEVSSGSDVEDLYRLERQPVPFQEGRHWSVYSFMLGEFENEHSYIDKIRFYSVDHDSDVAVATTPDGQILTYSNPNLPIFAVDNYGFDWLSSLLEPDDIYYEGFPGDYLLLDFGNADVSQAAKLVLRANFEFKKDTCIHVQVLNELGEWTDLSVLRTREYWSTLIVDLSGRLPNPDGTLKIRLYFTGIHRIDYVGLDTTPQANITTTQIIVMLASHSNNGNVALKLLLDDQVYAELVPGDQITLKFILRNTKRARTFLMFIEGHYLTLYD